MSRGFCNTETIFMAVKFSLLVVVVFIGMLLGTEPKSPNPIPSYGISIENQEKETEKKEETIREKGQVTKPTVSPVIPDLPQTPERDRNIENAKNHTRPPSTNEKITWNTPQIIVACILAFLAFLQFIMLSTQFYYSWTDRRITDRAWVMVSFDHSFSVGEDRIIQFKMTNTGKTPGHIKEITISGFGEFTNRLTPIPKGKIFTKMTIFPGENILRWQPNPNWPDIPKNGRLNLWGVIVYDDVFGKRRFTRFHRIHDRESGYFLIPLDVKEKQNDAN